MAAELFLAIEGGEETVGGRGINLIPAEVRERRAEERFRKTIRVLFLAAGLLIVASIGISVGYLRVLGLERERVGRELREVEPVVEAVRSLKQEAAIMNGQAERLERILEKRSGYSKVLQNIARAAPFDVRLTRVQASPEGTLVIGGVSSSITSVGVFIDELFLLPEIQDMELKKAEALEREGRVEVRFELEGRIKR